MSARQLRLFKHPKPLLERFGVEFFRSVPAVPGVYIMSGEAGRVLYVGQSKNLRTRLGTYRNANPDHVGRKVIRLVHAVRRIDWEECSTPALACVRENELLRLHRPKFNAANTYPKAYRFIGVATDNAELSLWITTQERPELYGAFKPGSLQGFGALLRLLWAALHQPCSHTGYPFRLLSVRPPQRYSFPLELISRTFGFTQLSAAIEEFLAGISASVITMLSEKLPPSKALSLFLLTLQATDLELLKSFYQFGPERNRRLRLQHNLETRQIPQERLDDLLVLSRGMVQSPAEPVAEQKRNSINR